MVAKDYKRAITHTDYRNPEKLKKYYHRVEKKIFLKPEYLKTEMAIYNYKFLDENYIVAKTGRMATPIVFGGGCLLFVLGLLFVPDEPLSEAGWLIVILCSILTIFFAIYSATMPKKESIFNRKDSLVTMTGFYWQKNITMSFEKSEFAYSTGGEDAIGAFQLQIIRPNKWQTFELCSVWGRECYESMSFITWYMDKNRPLPPGSAFDEFRDEDFKRRKAEGFPKPLYPSAIETPEATPEQQAERKKIGGW